MTNRHLKVALSSIALAASLSACASGGGDRVGPFSGKYDADNVGLATRAQAALIAGDFDQAITLAERAVANTPNDAGFRAVLGNAYFGAGRFASADAAYADSLAIYPSQPKVVLKRALALIAQGRNQAAVALLDIANGYIDPADQGLALAMAGRPQQAIAVLDQAARIPGADARVRQNLALSYAMAGDWAMARSIAAQDVPADQLDGRLQQWMALAAPSSPGQQMAALLGISPVAVDPGQPTRLAFNSTNGQQRLAVAQPAQELAPNAPVAVAAAQPIAAGPSVELKLAPAQPSIQAERPHFEAQPIANVRVTEIPVADVELAEFDESKLSIDLPEPEVEQAPAPQQASVASVAAMPMRMAQAQKAPAPGLSSDATRLTESARAIRADAARPKGNSQWVVQLGAYSKRNSLTLGWEHALARFAPIGQYKPMAARTTFEGQQLYRLAAHGFTSGTAARDFCVEVRSAGGECFVRQVAGDTPFRLASR